MLHHHLPHSSDFDVLTGKVPEVGCNKYARIPIEQFPNCGQWIVVRLHQKKSGQRRPFVMELYFVRVTHVAFFHDQMVVFWAFIPRRVIIPHVSMEPAISVFMVTALGSNGCWSARGRLYERSVTMVANQNCRVGRENGRESRVRGETNQGYREPIFILLVS
jgi:hypothetical protein